MRVDKDTLGKMFNTILLSRGLEEEDADLLSSIFLQNSLDGVYSHGANRFPRFVSYLESGAVSSSSKCETVYSFGAFERWDGHLGPGPLGAAKATARAIELSKRHGLGIVALGNTNHWMRGGTYGWQAADKGAIGIMWSNTMPNMPVWGGTDPRIGNNPLVISVPISSGRHFVFDAAMSQFSYGKLEEYRLRGERLPVPGGYDKEGNLTTDAAAIEESRRPLPAGYWKGSGLSLALDMVVSVLTLANSVHDIGKFTEERGLSQIFIVINASLLSTPEKTDEIAMGIIKDIKESKRAEGSREIRYPGEREYSTRMENTKNGIPVADEVWKSITSLLS